MRFYMLYNESFSNIINLGRFGVSKGIRTPVTAVKGQCPRPLDDGNVKA